MIKIKFIRIFIAILFLASISLFVNCREKDEEYKYKDRLSQYTADIKNNPNDAWNYYMRGGVYSLLKEYDKAIDDFNKAISLNDKISDFYAGLSITLLKKGNSISALEAINKAISIHPTVSYYYYRAYCYDSLNKPHEALRDYTLFLNTRPVANPPKIEMFDMPEKYLFSLKRRAAIYLVFNEYEKAITDTSEAMKIYDKDPDLFLLRGFAYNKQDKPDEALKDFNKSLEINSSFSVAYIHISAVYAKKNDKDTSEKYLIKGLEKGFKDYNIIYGNNELMKMFGKEKIDSLIMKYNKK